LLPSWPLVSGLEQRVGVMWGFAMAMGAVAPLLVGYLRDIFPDFRIAFMSLVIIALIGAIMSCFLPGKTRNS